MEKVEKVTQAETVAEERALIIKATDEGILVNIKAFEDYEARGLLEGVLRNMQMKDNVRNMVHKLESEPEFKKFFLEIIEDLEKRLNPKKAERLLEIIEDLEKRLNPKKAERLLEAVEGKLMITYDMLKGYQKAVEAGSMTHIPEPFVVSPTYMTEKAVGADCFASEEVIIHPGQVKIVPTGIKAKFNGDSEGLFPFIRSSIPKTKELILANGVGVIEEDYYGNEVNDGDIGFMFWNIGSSTVTIERFERIGQIVLLPILRFDNAGRAGMTRGASGSTGK